MIGFNLDKYYYLESKGSYSIPGTKKFIARSFFNNWSSPECLTEQKAIEYGEMHSELLIKLFNVENRNIDVKNLPELTSRTINYDSMISHNCDDLFHRKKEFIKILGLSNGFIKVCKNIGHDNNKEGCSFYQEDVLDICEKYKCNQVIFVHNHPDGANYASEEDYDAAESLEEFLLQNDITLLKCAIVLPTKEIIYYNEGHDLPLYTVTKN